MATRKQAKVEVIKYLVSDDKGEFVIELQPDWKITFAAVNPAAATSYREGFCLRVYEGQKLRAVFCNVQKFRDLSIPLARKITKETGAAEWTSDSLGNFEESRKVNVEHQLVEGDGWEEADLIGD